MCLATVYVEKDDQREEVMRDVARIRPEGGGFRLISFLGESRVFQASIKSIDLVNGSIVLESVTTGAHHVASADQDDEPKGQTGPGPA